MNASELKSWIDSLAQDIDFEYRGKLGSICPFNRNNISLCYNDHEITVTSVDEVMTEAFIDGKSLEDVCEELEI